jgi:hypothetical protein
LQSGEEKKIKKRCERYRGFLFGKIGPKSPPHHEGGKRKRKNLNSPYLENTFQQLAKLDRKN